MSDIDRRTALKMGAAGAVTAGTALALAPPSTATAAPSAQASGGPLMQVSGLPSLGWIAQFGGMALAVRANTERVASSRRWKFARRPEPISLLNPMEFVRWIEAGETNKLLDFVVPAIGPVTGGDTSHSIDSYRALFADPAIPLPPVADTFESEATFAESFVAGADPTRLMRLTAVPAKFPITSDHLAAVPELGAADLAAAINAGRIYWIDYERLAGLPGSSHFGMAKYMYAPMVAFCVPSDGGAALAFAIQCGQNPAESPIYTPADGYSWKLSRNCVLTAHNVQHEVLTHLGQAHLASEALIKAAVATLPAGHPLAALLGHHFAGTLFINGLVPDFLVNTGGWLDTLSGTPSADLLSWLDRQLPNYSYRDHYVPTLVGRMGTQDTKALPHHPFRDDGLLLWNALSSWMTDFVGAFFPSDAAVRADTALQAFAGAVELKDFGATPGQIADRHDLVEILTMALWTAGPFHAAVNYSQLDWMGFVPAGPLSGFTEAPTGTGHAEQDWLDNFPPVDVALAHITALAMLTSVQDSVLGHYGTTFDRTPAAEAAKRFREALAAAELEITARNRSRTLEYRYLLPSKVPASISI